MSERNGDQIHPASPIRIDRARREGNLAKSHELASALNFLGGLSIAFLLLGGVAYSLKDWTLNNWQAQQQQGIRFEAGAMIEQLQSLAFGFLMCLAPFLLLMMLVGWIAHWIQTGPLFNPNRVAPDLSRLAPIRWWERVFSLQALSFPLAGLPKSVLALCAMVAFSWWQRDKFMMLAAPDAEQVTSSLFTLVWVICLQVAGVLVGLSILDYLIQRYSYARRLRMTDSEMREELRMQNGDPQLRSRRQQLRDELSRLDSSR